MTKTLFVPPQTYFSNVNRYTRAGKKASKFAVLSVENGQPFITSVGVH